MTTITIDRAVLEQAEQTLKMLTKGKGFTASTAGEISGLIGRISAALAAQPSGPAWQDAPTVPGLWVNLSVNELFYVFEINNPKLSVFQQSGERWYGPLPEDTK